MAGRRVVLRRYGEPGAQQDLAWSWVDDRLRQAGTYWVTAVSDGYPHPRPVWGVWDGDLLHLSIGTPAIRRQVPRDPRVTVHLGSGTDVVIVEGRARIVPVNPAEVLAAYDAKYDWSYDAGEYGALIEVQPERIMAWRAAGTDGRDGFGESGKWSFA